MTMSTSPLGRSERFNTDLHVSEKDLVPVRSDGGIEIYAAFGTSAGLRDHLLNHLRPWLQRHVHWSLNNWQKLVGCYNEDAMWMSTH
jgi:hypothetical protein